MTNTNSYRLTLNRLPTPIDTAIAKHPQNRTRKAPLVLEAPPTCADMLPNTTRDNSEMQMTAGIKVVLLTSNIINSGNEAPIEKDSAEYIAA